PSIGSTSAGSTSTPVAVLIASKDDRKALAALDKYKHGPEGSRDAWSTATYDGATVTSGSAGGGNVVYAITNHTAVIGSSSSVVERDRARRHRGLRHLQADLGHAHDAQPLPARQRNARVCPEERIRPLCLHRAAADAAERAERVPTHPRGEPQRNAAAIRPHRI